jgi:hypothetical protein
MMIPPRRNARTDITPDPAAPATPPTEVKIPEPTVVPTPIAMMLAKESFLFSVVDDAVAALSIAAFLTVAMFSSFLIWFFKISGPRISRVFHKGEGVGLK